MDRPQSRDRLPRSNALSACSRPSWASRRSVPKRERRYRVVLDAQAPEDLAARCSLAWRDLLEVVQRLGETATRPDEVATEGSQTGEPTGGRKHGGLHSL